jgi:hypothetical protein
MARQIINTGTTGNDGTGDDLRTGATKINDNFSELYGDVAALQVSVGSAGGLDGISFDNKQIVFEGITDDSSETRLTVTDPTKDNTITLPDSSGTIALINDIKGVVDSAYISLLTGTAFDSGGTLTLIAANSVDSGEVLALIDSAYVNARLDVSSFLDSAEAIAIIDSAYVSARQSYAYASLTGTPTILDSDMVKVFTVDSSEVTNMIDSAYINARATDNLDSGEVLALIDSDYVKARAVEVDLRNYTVATVPAGSHGKLIFTTNGASGNPCLAVYDSAAGFYKRIALGTQIST